MSNNRINNLLTFLAEEALANEFKPAQIKRGDVLNEDQKNAVETIHNEFVTLSKNGTLSHKTTIDPTVEKRFYNQTVAAFVSHPDGTNFENTNKIAAAMEYLSLFKSKPTEPNATPPSNTPSTLSNKK